MSSLSQIIEKQKEDKKRVHELESENGRLEALVKDQIETIRQLTTSGSSVRKPRTVNFVPSKCSFLTFCSCMLLVYLVTWQCKNSMIFFHLQRNTSVSSDVSQLDETPLRRTSTRRGRKRRSYSTSELEVNYHD